MNSAFPSTLAIIVRPLFSCIPYYLLNKIEAICAYARIFVYKKLLNKGLYTLKVLVPMDSSSEPPEQHKPLRACCYYSFNAFDLDRRKVFLDIEAGTC